MTKHALSVPALAVLLTVVAACGGAESAPEAAGEAVADTAVVDTPAAPAEPAGAVDITEADLDLYERAFAKEIEIVRAAGERASSAATPAERGAAMQQQWESESVPAAARAAGVPEERYRFVRETVHEIFKTLDFQDKIDGPMSMDMSRASEETKAKLARDPFDALTPSAAAALRARMDRLVPAWIDYVKMTAVAG
jgi:hypothetical protein